MKKEEIKILVDLRQEILSNFNKLRDYKNNTNAIMKEIDHARVLSKTIVEIDKVLKDYVNFSDKN